MSTDLFCKYGVVDLTPAEVVHSLSAALDVQFEQHDGDFWGTYFLARLGGDEKVKIVHNKAVDEDDLPYLEYKHMPVVVAVSFTTPERLDAIEAAMPQLVVLARREV